MVELNPGSFRKQKTSIINSYPETIIIVQRNSIRKISFSVIGFREWLLGQSSNQLSVLFATIILSCFPANNCYTVSDRKVFITIALPFLLQATLLHLAGGLSLPHRILGSFQFLECLDLEPKRWYFCAHFFKVGAYMKTCPTITLAFVSSSLHKTTNCLRPSKFSGYPLILSSETRAYLRTETSRPRQIELRKNFIAINPHKLFFRFSANWDIWIQSVPGFTLFSVHLLGNKKKNFRCFDLQALAATMMVRIVPPVLPRNFTAFWNNIHNFQMSHEKASKKRVAL